MENNVQTMVSEDKILSVEDVGKILNISEMSVYRAIKRESLPMKKRGGKLRIMHSDLIQWIKYSPAEKKRTKANV